MKAIMISIKPKWAAKILNGEKTIEVRTSKALATAIQKLIDENGYADIYVYCSKSNYFGYISNRYIGKVVFKFRCYKVEEIKFIMDYNNGGYYNTNSYTNEKCFERDCCLTQKELDVYINNNNLIKRDNVAYALFISNLEIFTPKELSEFNNCDKYPYTKYIGKAPQNFCYVEGE